MRPFSHPAIDALRASGEELRGQAAVCADERRLSETTAKILRETGAMRLIQPARYGGLEADPRCFVEAMMTAAEYDGAAGWVLGVVGVHNWHIGLYPDSVQQEVWGADPDTWISSSYNYVGKARRVAGGFRLTGRWGFSSGCEHAGWVFVGGVVFDDHDQPLEMRHFLLPRADYEIIDVWNVAGLCGSGSNDIKVEDSFVPDARSMSWPDLQAHKCPGTEVNTSPLFRVPWGSMFLNAVTAPLVGMARGMLDESVALVKQRMAGYLPPGPPTGPFDAKRMWPAVSMARLAEVSSDIDSARLQMLDNLGDVYEHVLDRPDRAGPAAVPLEVRARARRDQVMAARRATDAANTIFSLAGGRGLSLKSPVQRLWRDTQAGAHHVVNGADQALTSYGAWMMGEPLEDMLV
ncbi:MAG: acyl-CoA dehydrogenase [Actinomycetota bacterium]|nr:acyl-CoA dehydrogenase [Actinomycetota bacterium]